MSAVSERRSPREAGNEVCLGGHAQSITDISTEAQRKRLLTTLRHEPITTFEARRLLNICHPAMRVKELRDSGHNIVTRLVTIPDDQGRLHQRVALYSLVSGAKP